MHSAKQHRLAGYSTFLVLTAVLIGFLGAILPASAQTPTPVRGVIAGDRVRISVKEQPDMNRVYAVAGDGTIDFPLVGRIRVVDLTTEEAADLIESLLKQSYFKEANVTVEVAEFVEGGILVLGAVNSPGAHDFRGDQILTLMELIAMHGGLARGAAGTEVRIIRWKPGGSMERQIITVDVQSMMETLDFSNDQFLRPRDIVMVPSLGDVEGLTEYLVLGEAGNPGFHPYSKDLDMIRAISRAGGVSRYAKMDSVRILRPNEAGDYTAIPVDLSRLFGAADMTMNVPVLAGDIIFVPSIEQASRGQVYFLGEVKKPGPMSLPLDQRITLAKAILNSGGFTDFANTGKVKLIREGPDGSKQSLAVNVGRILKTGEFENDVPLEAGDVIIVPERIIGF
ncbi:MAG: SLBB domain-containing protein [Verrucomicrobia bacterium]|nr:SLBB domain-containing protein [Verrucomicrobiota bacterium]